MRRHLVTGALGLVALQVDAASFTPLGDLPGDVFSSTARGILLANIQPVPVPAPALLFASAIGALMLARRRRDARH